MKYDKPGKCNNCGHELKVYDTSITRKYRLMISCPNCHVMHGLIEKKIKKLARLSTLGRKK